MQTRLCKHREAPEDSRSQINNHLTEYISVQRRIRETEKISAEKQKSPSKRAFLFLILGWLMGLEPTTTGITILDSTN